MLIPGIKRILMTADTIGGVWTYAIELSKSLVDNNIEVHLACMGKSLSGDQLLQISNIKNLTVYSKEYKLEWMQDPWEDIEKAGQWLMKLQEQIQADIIHLNNYVHGNLAWNVPVIMVAHSCVFSWWKSVKEKNIPDEWNLYYKNVKAGLQAADLVIGVSQTYLNEVNNLYGPLNGSRWIYNGTNLGNYFIGEKKPLIFSMGRVWDEGKNLKLLASISDKINWRVSIAGSIDHPDNLETKDHEGIFTGHLNPDQIRKFLSEASIFVLPAKYEPFGLSALEAALSGCALVLADIPTLKEIWGNAAIFFDLNDPISLINKINTLIEDEDLLLDYQKRAFKKAQNYDVKKMTASYLDAYKQILNHKTEK